MGKENVPQRLKPSIAVAFYGTGEPVPFRGRAVAFLAVALLIALAGWTQSQAQNVEGQIVASQFGEFQLPGVG
jgi:hypothetical protein